MAVKWVMDIVRWLDKLTLPKWLNDLLLKLTNDVLYEAIKIVGKEVWDFIVSECIRVSRLENISGTEKAQIVLNNTLELYGNIDKTTSSIINLCIELAVQLLKKEGDI